MKTTSERTRRDGKLLEEHGIAAPEFGTPWEYVSRGPYRLQWRHSWQHPSAIEARDVEYLEVAVGMFDALAIPVLGDFLIVVIDESFHCVLGYGTGNRGLRATGMAWWGTAETFGVLERYGDVSPVDLAIWESIAREYV